MQELRLFLARQTIAITIFILYLFIVICTSIIRSLKLVRIRYSFSRPKPVSLEDLIDGSFDGNMLAKIALSSRIIYEPPYGGNKPKMLLTKADDEIIQVALQKAKSEFRYLWEASYAIVRSIKRLVPLTLLISLSVTVLEAMNILRGGFMTEREATGMVQLFEATADLLRWLLWGIAVSLVLFVASSYFEELLMSRKRNWKRFLSAIQRDKLILLKAE